MFVIAAKLAMVGLGLLGVYAVIRIGETLGGASAGVLCGVLAALFPPSIVYGSRCMSEMASGTLCVVAVLLALGRQQWKLALAGCVAALAIFVRYQSGIVALGLFAWLVMQRRRREALVYATAALVTGLAGGLLDWLTWGAPFHSFVTYVRFNLVEGQSANFGTEPFSYYFTVAWSAVGISIIAIAVGLWTSARSAAGLLAIVVVYVLAHALVGHKEFRFIMPIVPLMLALAGVGLAALLARVRARGERATTPPERRARAARRQRDRTAGAAVRVGEAPQNRIATPVWIVAGVVALAMGWQTARASFEDFGQQHPPVSGSQPLWHRQEAINRLLWTAGEQPDLCGLALIGYGPVWTGGFTYLHRDVPVVWATPEDALSKPGLGVFGASANYVLTDAGATLPAGYTTAAIIGASKLARRSGPCSAPPAAFSRVFPK